MLESLSAKNFKSWKNLPELRFGKLTGLFGANSSGKSGLLQLLLLLKQTVESSDRRQPLNLGGERSFVSLGTFSDLLHGHEKEKSFSFRLEWTAPDGLEIPGIAHPSESKEDEKLSFGADIRQGSAGRLHVERFEYGFSKYKFGMRAYSGSETQYKLFPIDQDDVHFRRTQGRPWKLPRPERFYGFPDQVRAYYQNAAFLADFELALEEQFSGLRYLGPLREYPQREYTWAGVSPADMGQRGEHAIDAILASREDGQLISRGRGRRRLFVEEYVAFWLAELGLIDEFGVEAITPDSNLYRVWVKKSKSSTRVLITDVGFGVSQILPVLTLLYYAPEGSTVFLEQPEIHLHPSVQAGLADVLLDAIDVRGIQVVLESHSEHLLRRLQRRVAEECVQAEDVALYFCNSKGGESKLVPLELDIYGGIVNWPDGFFGDEFEDIEATTAAISKRVQEDGKDRD